MSSIFLIFACWALSFLFAGIEAGVLAVDPVRLRSQAKQKQPAAQRLRRLLNKPERLLVTVLLVTNMANILALMVLTRDFVRAFGYAGFFFTLILALPIYVFILSILPKSLFRRFPSRALAPLAGLLELISILLWPVLEFGDLLARLFDRRLENERPGLFAAREELKQITAQSEREGSLTAAERTMIHNVVDLPGVKVSEVMIPLTRVVAVTPETSIADVLRLSTERSVDRIPVVARSGEPLGLLHVLDLLFAKTRPQIAGAELRRVIMTRKDESAYQIIRRLRAARQDLAAVVDEQRKLVGIVTISDLVRRLVRNA